MKIAISGKGGVGKTTLAAALSLLAAQRGRRVLAVDADPDANLAMCLGIDEATRGKIVPVSRQRALIEERTGAKVRQYGQIFTLNPDVADIVENHSLTHRGVALMVLGSVPRGGSGCACPENVLIRALVADLILRRDDLLVMDMEAGTEHLGRATARGVQTMVLVVEPGQRSVDSARRVMDMGREIGLDRFQLVANKVCNDSDEAFIRQALDLPLLGVIPHTEALRENDRPGRAVLDGLSGELLGCFAGILTGLEDVARAPEKE